MPVSLKHTLLVTCCLSLSAPAWSQDRSGSDEDPRDVVIVTGTRIPTPIDQVGRSVSIISADDIELRQQNFVYDALQSVPGVQVSRSGSFGALTTVSLRGLPTDQTLVVQDGIVLNDPASFGNAFNFADLDTSDIERIEVLRGAQSTLYGSNAIGGVINIVTKDGREGFGGSALFEGGSFDTIRGNATVRGGSEILSGRLTVSAASSNGFSYADVPSGTADDDRYRNITVSGKAGFRPTETLSFETVVRFVDAANEFDDFAGIDGDREGDTQSLTLAGYVTHDLFDGQWENRLAATYLRGDRQTFNGDVLDFDALGTRLSLEYLGTVQPADWLTTVYGAEYEEQESETAVGFGGNDTIETYSGFALVQITPAERITVNAGIRHDANSDFENATTASVSAAIRIPIIEILLRGSYAEGFRAPSVGELSFNPDLEPEDSEGWDVGLARAFFEERLLIEATYFDQSITNEIAFDLNIFNFLNVAEFETSGVEVAVKAQPFTDFDIAATYTYTDAFNVTGDIASLNQPDHRVSADVAWRTTDKLTLGLSVLYNGTETASGQRILDAYTLVTVRGTYAVTDDLELFARLENATDADYQDTVGYSTAPFSVFGGVRARY